LRNKEATHIIELVIKYPAETSKREAEIFNISQADI
jgi:hypothetical protein